MSSKIVPKRCPKCGSLGPFVTDRTRPDGLTSHCRSCRAQKQKSYPPGYGAARTRKSYWKHHERRRAAAKAAYIRDIEKQRARAKCWWEKVKNLPEHKAKYKSWVDSHREIVRAYCRNDYAKRRGQDGIITADEWLDVLEFFDNRCAYCFVQSLNLTQDHVIPLSRGGENVVGNVVPACNSCNTRKRNHLIFTMLQPPKRSAA